MKQNPFIEICKIILLICLDISIVLACNPPYNSKWPNAEYPYAQAPDGCSSWSNNPQQVRDTWGPVSFKNACNRHDKCYYTYGSSWQACNERYLKDLNNACWNDLRTPIKIAGKTYYLPPDPVRLAACKAVAETYYIAVQSGVALGVFKSAQKMQKKYNDWIGNNNYCPKPTPKPPQGCPPDSSYHECYTSQGIQCYRNFKRVICR